MTRPRHVTVIIALVFFSSILLPDTIHAQIVGCTDSLANNYNAAATRNDGSCTYDPSSVSPVQSLPLPEILSETSGLVLWNGDLWTHNDDTDTTIYSFSALTGSILHREPVPHVINHDWEEIAQDSEFVYIGDFGNNENGNRTDLHILRIAKQSILDGRPDVDTIGFSYEDQVDFTPAGADNTDFDCEAFVVTTDSIYLFTKQWIHKQTAVYALPNTPGQHQAVLRDTWNANGLITGATFLDRQRLILLCGYSSTVQPFLILLYDFEGSRYFSGNKRKVDVQLPFHQVEGIASADGTTVFISNEALSAPPLIDVHQGFHLLDLRRFLEHYLWRSPSGIQQHVSPTHLSLYPHPVSRSVLLELSDGTVAADYRVCNSLGRTVLQGVLRAGVNSLSLDGLPAGLYSVRIAGDAMRMLNFIKISE